jgi:5'-3' exonuclease
MLPVPQPVLLLVDGMNVVRRVYEAVPGNDDNKVEGVLASSWGSIMRALREHGPTHFLAAFDHGGPTWRHKLYPDYKVSRDPMAPALRESMPWFLGRLNEAGLRALSVPGVEADDVIATLAMRAIERGFRVIVLSTDKDLCRLVEHGVELRDHFKNCWRDQAWVRERFGVLPRQITDYLALVGDDMDDIPGVPGVGVKTAVKLLAEYGDVKGVLAAAPDIKGKLGESLRQNAPLAMLSFRLASLKLDVDLGRLTPRDIQLPQEMRFFPVPSSIHAALIQTAPAALPAPYAAAAARPVPERRHSARP